MAEDNRIDTEIVCDPVSHSSSHWGILIGYCNLKLEIMSWFKNQKELGFFLKFCFKVLRSGNIPQHVAIIMDGNRRFAKKHGLQKSEGHSKGFEKLAEVSWFILSPFKHLYEHCLGPCSLYSILFHRLVSLGSDVSRFWISSSLKLFCPPFLMSVL